MKRFLLFLLLLAGEYAYINPTADVTTEGLLDTQRNLSIPVKATKPLHRKQPRRKKLRRKKRRTARPMTQAPMKVGQPFSKTISHFVNPEILASDPAPHYQWESESPLAFNELIFSWNALRPTTGKITFYVSVRHEQWSPWHRIAEWGANSQKTFLNKLNSYVHTKHVRVEMQRNMFANAFRIKAEFAPNTPKTSLSALFACVSDLTQFGVARGRPAQESVLVKDVPRQSQMVIDHPRARELCSPASTSMLVSYFNKKLYANGDNANLHDYICDFADKVLDKGTLDIYGSWPLNVAQAHEASKGNIFYRVERLNNFNELYDYLAKDIPVAVSVRKLRGGATPYTNGHFMVVIGWHKETNNVICIDPAFRPSKKTLKTYRLDRFMEAWGLSRNLGYVAIPKWELIQARM